MMSAARTRHAIRALKYVLRVPLALLAGLVPRRRNLWVFGAWYGKRYADNSRYLFEYVSWHERDIQAVWMTRDEATMAELRAGGLQARRIGSLGGYWTCCRAGGAFFSVASDDVDFAGAWRAKLIQLWHGTPLKRICADDPTLERRRQPWFYRLMVRAGSWCPFLQPRWDVVISASPHINARLASALALPPDRVRATGQPRADVILADPPPAVQAIEDLRRRWGARRVVAYVPTHREEGRSKLDLMAGATPAAIDACLARHEAVMVMKMHYHDASRYGGPAWQGTRIHWLGEQEAPDVNRLLPHVDVLITDYSSVFFDYLLLDRPIVFAPFDLEDYLSTPGLYDDYAEVAPGPICRDWSAVLSAVDQVLSGQDDHARQRREVGHRVNAYFDTRNCRRVADMARELLHLPRPGDLSCES